MNAVVHKNGACFYVSPEEAKDAGLRLHRGRGICAQPCPGCQTDVPPGQLVTTDWRLLLRLGARFVAAPPAPPAPTLDASRAIDADIFVPVPEGKVLRPYQLAAVKYARVRNRVLIADEMGCVDGSTEIQVMRAGKSFKCTVTNLYRKTYPNKNSHPKQNPDIATHVRALCGDEFRQHQLISIIDMGTRSTVRVSLQNGKSVVLTPDHEILLLDGSWKAAGALNPGDMVVTNGTPVCSECGSDDRVSTYKYSKFKGLCRKCMYAHRTKPSGGKFVDNDGYVRVSGQRGHPRANTTGQVYEHILVMEKILGRPVLTSEHVHHKNENRSDNSPDNLVIKSPGDHHREHRKYRNLHGGRSAKGGEVVFRPTHSEVVSVTPCGETHVYDLVMADPYRNFVANGIVVHNCGKTIETVAIANADSSISRILVVCPTTLKPNWKREIHAWDSEQGQVMICDHAKEVPAQWPEGRVWCICNPEKLVAARSKKAADLVERAGGLWEKLMLTHWDLLILDEAHRFKNEKAARTGRVLGTPKKGSVLAQEGLAQRCGKLVALTGTPIPNRVRELWPLLRVLAPASFRLKGDFLFRYCGPKQEEIFKPGCRGVGEKVWTFDGASNLPELQLRLRTTCMIRRLKSDVVKELPPKTRQILPLPGDTMKRQADAERFAWMQLFPKLNELQADALIAEAMGDAFAYENALDRLIVDAEKVDAAKIAAERQALALAKAPLVVEHAMDALENPGQKIVVMAHHRTVIERLTKEFGDRNIGVACVYGGTPMKDRQRQVDLFQADQKTRVFIGGLHAAGVGLTLTAATIMLFAEADWQPGVLAQCEDRIHRIGQLLSVLIQYLVVDGSIEALVIAAALRKQRVAEQALDGAPRPVTKRREYPKATSGDRSLCSQALAAWATASKLKQLQLRDKTAELVLSLSQRDTTRRLSDGEIWLCRKLMRENRSTLPQALRPLV
jgi:SWI/SNF-related matrix-associated actin-dependent regulator 1 of chromatin subfamily A